MSSPAEAGRSVEEEASPQQQFSIPTSFSHGSASGQPATTWQATNSPGELGVTQAPGARFYRSSNPSPQPYNPHQTPPPPSRPWSGFARCLSALVGVVPTTPPSSPPVPTPYWQPAGIGTNGPTYQLGYDQAPQPATPPPFNVPATASPSTPVPNLPASPQDVASLAALLGQIEQTRGSGGKQSKDLTTSEVTAYTTNLERPGLQAWITRFLHLVSNKNIKLAELLKMSIKQAQVAIEQDVQFRLADAYLSRQIDCVLDPKSDKVQAWRMKLDNNLEVAASGILKLEEIQKMCKITNGVEIRLAEREFEEKSFFSPHMSRDDAIKKAWALVREFRLLKRCDGDASIMFEILKKMPDRLFTETNHLFDSISHGQVLEKLPYTLDQFVQIVAIHLSSDTRARRTQPKPKPLGPQVNQTNANPTPNGGDVVCLACGQKGHRARECPTTCSACGLKMCPGNQGKSLSLIHI